MKIASVNNQTNNFKGSFTNKAVDFIAKHPIGVAGLAASSVVTQKLVLSAAEVTLGPAMDIGIGKAFSAIKKDDDGRFEQSSKVQAVRTLSQTIGGTIVGVAARALCIGGITYGIIKGAPTAGSVLGGLVAKDKSDPYQLQKQGEAWGRSLGGALATVVMMGTNFLIDAPLINVFNKQFTKMFLSKKEENPQEVKEVK